MVQAPTDRTSKVHSSPRRAEARYRNELLLREIVAYIQLMDWSLCIDVESSPDRMSGAWVIKGTRVPADAIVENAEEGFSPEQIVSELYPTVSVASIRRVLSFANAQRHAIHPA